MLLCVAGSVSAQEESDTVRATFASPSGITWDADGTAHISSTLVIGGETTIVENPYDDKGVKDRLDELEGYNNAKTWLTGAGIVIDNQDTLNRVELTTDATGLLHSRLEQY